MPTTELVNLYKEAAAATFGVVFMLAFIWQWRQNVKQGREHRDEMRAVNKERAQSAKEQTEHLNAIIAALTAKPPRRARTHDEEATGEQSVKGSGGA